MKISIILILFLHVFYSCENIWSTDQGKPDKTISYFNIVDSTYNSSDSLLSISIFEYNSQGEKTLDMISAPCTCGLGSCGGYEYSYNEHGDTAKVNDFSIGGNEVYIWEYNYSNGKAVSRTAKRENDGKVYLYDTMLYKNGYIDKRISYRNSSYLNEPDTLIIESITQYNYDDSFNLTEILSARESSFHANNIKYLYKEGQCINIQYFYDTTLFIEKSISYDSNGHKLLTTTFDFRQGTPPFKTLTHHFYSADRSGFSLIDTTNSEDCPCSIIGR